MSTSALPFEAPIIELEQRIDELRKCAAQEHVDITDDIRNLEVKHKSLIQQIYANLTPWDRVRIARHPDRPVFTDYVRLAMDEFVEIHGDRAFGDDRAIVAGLCRIGPHRVVLVGQQKGRDTKEKIAVNFGMPHPEGLRKAKRLMRMAEKYALPVVTILDTPGAYPGIGAEERGISFAIADNILAMTRLRAPILSVIIGEGCSGGALAIGVPDRILMLEYSYYAVISPEGCAAILWRSGEQAPLAAAAMRLTADDLVEMNVVDQIVPEPVGGAHRDPTKMGATLKQAIVKNLDRFAETPLQELLDQRHQKYRRIGVFFEDGKLVSCLKRTCKRKIKGATKPRRASRRKAKAASG